MASTDSRVVVTAAILGNLAIAVSKFAAAILGGSAAMLSESFHSLVDTGNGGLLLLGMHLSKRPPDDRHPFGHGKELYFYVLIVGILVFGIGGGMSIWEGVSHLVHRESISNATLNYVVLAVSAVFEGTTWFLSLRAFLAIRGSSSFAEAIRRSKDPTSFSVLFEDSAALIGLAIAALGIFLSEHLGIPIFDGIASILIGLILCAIATILIYKSKDLLIGEAADPVTLSRIKDTAASDPAVKQVVRMLTMHMSPDQIILNLDLEFNHDLSGDNVEAEIDRIESAIRRASPSVRYIFIEVESLVAHRRRG